MKYKQYLFMSLLGMICFASNVQAKDLSKNVVEVKKLYNGDQNAIGQVLGEI